MVRNILICDDEPVLIQLMKLTLEEKGFKVFGAVDGNNYRRKIEMCNPEAIILDLNMITIPGDEICRFLKNNFKTRNIPVIIFSSSLNGRKRALEAGADFFIEKKGDLEELEKVLNGIMTSTIKT